MIKIHLASPAFSDRLWVKSTNPLPNPTSGVNARPIEVHNCIDLDVVRLVEHDRHIFFKS
jgi:hypothetical protein